MSRGRDRSLRRVLGAAAADPAAAAPLVHDHLRVHGWSRLAESAASHGVAPRTWAAVRAAGAGGQDGAAGLEHEARTTVLRAARVHADLRTAGAALAAAGITPTVVKGPALADLAYRAPGQRTYDDLDLLVRAEELGPALDALEASGAERLDGNWPEMARLRVGQVRLRTASGGVVDLHWHLLNDLRLRAAFELDRERWQERLRPASLAGVAVTVMDPTSTLVHVAVHAATSGGHRLVWLQDLAELVRAPGFDGSDVAVLASATGTTLAVAGMLARTRRVLGVAPASGLGTGPGPAPGWWALTAATDRVSPPAAFARGGSMSQLVARSIRESPRASRRELGRRVAAFVRQGSRSHALTAERLFDPADPASMSHPAGDQEDRAEFLRAVGS